MFYLFPVLFLCNSRDLCVFLLQASRHQFLIKSRLCVSKEKNYDTCPQYFYLQWASDVLKKVLFIYDREFIFIFAWFFHSLSVLEKPRKFVRG